MYWVGVCTFELNCLWRTEVGVRIPGAGVTGGCWAPEVGAGPNMCPFAKKHTFLSSGPSL